MSFYSEVHEQFLSALLKHKVKFLIIGGHAAIYYGVNRNTGDLDVLIEPSKENGQKLLLSLNELKLEVPEIEPEEFEKPIVLAFGFEPDGIDVLNYTPGLEFSEVYNNAVDTSFMDLKIKMIDIRDLIRNKELLNRQGEKSLLDKYDVEVLKKIIQKKK